MDISLQTRQLLFFQLGLADQEEQIAVFIAIHRQIPPTIALSKASFWSKAPAAFLTEAIEDDSDWCELVDKLDCLLSEK